MADEVKKVPEELLDNDLDFVAGGVISLEDWNKMTTAERIAAKKESVANRKAGKPCILD